MTTLEAASPVVQAAASARVFRRITCGGWQAFLGGVVLSQSTSVGLI
ncbi:hypothetical protein [Mesorhizobium muleiense]|nr:hypothetical protein [Mesorhizobium muleiense]MCF6110365.1 hypothetical protein [Mesorhizobium muleiense]